tara:strand:- start:2 stop:493 length:492 start_codon:yes stop_codon:yes gene_type:complete
MRFINFFSSKLLFLFKFCHNYLNKKNFENYFKSSNCQIGLNSRFFKPQSIKIGNNVFIGENVLINCGKGGTVSIGDNTSLAEGVKVFSWYKDSLPGFPDNIIQKNVVLGKHCRIGYNAIIMPGVTIGDYCKISPSSVVYSDVQSESTAIGNPAKILKIKTIKK